MSAVSQAAAGDIDRPTSAPPAGSAVNGSRLAPYANLAPTLSTPDRVPTASALGSTSKAKGMQLGASKLPVSSSTHMPAEWAEEAAAEAAAEEDAGQGNPWGNDDLMDVNADQDDWSESCLGCDVTLTERDGDHRCFRDRAHASCCIRRTRHPRSESISLAAAKWSVR